MASTEELTVQRHVRLCETTIKVAPLQLVGSVSLAVGADISISLHLTLLHYNILYNI